MNNLTIIGNVTKDPIIRTVNTAKGERKVCDVNIAVNSGYGENKTATYFKATYWDKIAEVCEKYVVKGTKIAVTGSVDIATREYQGKTYTDLVINFPTLELLGQSGQGGQSAPKGTPNYDRSPDAAPTVEADDDELPF